MSKESVEQWYEDGDREGQGMSGIVLALMLSILLVTFGVMFALKLFGD